MIPTSIIAEGEALHPDMAHLLIAGTLDDRVNEVSSLTGSAHWNRGTCKREVTVWTGVFAIVEFCRPHRLCVDPLLAPRCTRPTVPPGPLVLRQDADADLS